jgi:two-component system, chemotaxis family, sensor kinase CheA
MSSSLDYFQMEAVERLERMSSGLVALERARDDQSLINALFREAHSLKGAAGVSGLADISEICHKMEDLLSTMRDGSRQATEPMIDVLLSATDDVQKLVTAQTRRRECDVDPTAVIERLTNLDTTTEAASVTEQVSASAQRNNPDSRESGHSAADTVRLQVDMLETLGNLTGELMVAGDRFRQRLVTVKMMHTELRRKCSQYADNPAIHALLNSVSEDLHRLMDSFSSDVTAIDPLIAGIHEQVLDTRMLPLSVLFDSLPRFVRDSCREEDKQAEMHVNGANTRVDRQVLEQLRDPMIHLIRNAVAHGIESPAERERLGKAPLGCVRLTTSRHGDRIRIICEDDGRGIDHRRVLARAISAGLVDEAEATKLSTKQIQELILEPGFSTAEMITDVSGRGVGMDVVVSRLEALRGTLSIESESNKFTRFVLELPASMATLEGLLVEAAGHTYIVPTMSIERTARIKLSELQSSSGGELVMRLDDQAVPVTMLASLLGREKSGLDRTAANKPGDSHVLPVVVVRYRERLLAIGVDRLLAIQTIVARGLDDQLGTICGVAGATILGTGLPALILDPGPLMGDGNTASRRHETSDMAVSSEAEKETVPLLIVDDSLTTRMMEKSILESAGYTVDLAVSAEDALMRINESDYCLFVCDVEMPGMNGFELTRQLRADDRFAETPIIIVTSLDSKKHRREGLESGANAYIVKGEFDQNNLLKTVERLAGTRNGLKTTLPAGPAGCFTRKGPEPCPVGGLKQ